MNKNCLIILVALFSCDKINSASNEKIMSDSLYHQVIMLGNIEQSEWKYFQELESEIKRQEKNITEKQINQYIQDMIDRGLLAKPTLYRNTKEGTKFELVDYLTYKKYRLENPIDTMALFTVTTHLTKEDSLNYFLYDSLRAELIKILGSGQTRDSMLND